MGALFLSGEEDSRTITHRQCALDMFCLLDHLGIKRCRAIGLSMGGNILLHMATSQPDRIEAMVAVSATLYFPEQAREIVRQVPAPADQPASEWETMRKRHKLGDEQIDRDPLYPVEMAVEMYRSIPRAALWVVPNGGHGPVFFEAAGQFAEMAPAFFYAQQHKSLK